MASVDTAAMIDVLELLSKAYPDRHPGADTLEEYLRLLDDIPSWLLRRAARQHIEQSPWFPKISELRERAAKLSGATRDSLEGEYAFLRPCTTRSLAQRMLELEDDFTRTGRLAIAEWEQLARDFNKADRPHRAERTLQRLNERLGGDIPRRTHFLPCAALVLRHS